MDSEAQEHPNNHLEFWQLKNGTRFYFVDSLPEESYYYKQSMGSSNSTGFYSKERDSSAENWKQCSGYQPVEIEVSDESV